MKILFVDDEPKILQGLQRMLFHLNDDWDMHFVDGGMAALRELEVGDFDILVTDMRMPGMDGAELLTRVMEKHPDVIRIVLSGHAELEMTMRTVLIAHQYMVKPCQADFLVDTIERTYSLQSILNDPKLRAAIGEMDRLPSVPKLYLELTNKLQDPNACADDVIRIISQDPGMVAKVLQLVNSAFFVCSSTVVDIKSAVVRLGFQMVRTLVLTTEVFKPRPGARPIKDLENMQQHALATAMIAQNMFDDKKTADEAFMAAMLHDIGKLILPSVLGEKYDRFLQGQGENESRLFAREQSEFGFTHAEAGAYLLGIWGLPCSVVEAVAYHHCPQKFGKLAEFNLPAAVYLANCLTYDIDFGTEYIAELGVQDKIDTWREMAAEMVISPGGVDG